jgi:hypothetical protein
MEKSEATRLSRRRRGETVPDLSPGNLFYSSQRKSDVSIYPTIDRLQHLDSQICRFGELAP